MLSQTDMDHQPENDVSHRQPQAMIDLHTRDHYEPLGQVENLQAEITEMPVRAEEVESRLQGSIRPGLWSASFPRKKKS